MPSFIDLTGHVFSRLTVLSKADYLAGNPNIRWLCRCECGQETVVFGFSLKTGMTTSCGCYMLETSRLNGLRRKTHGLGTTPEYYAWAAMKGRCFNENNHARENYGGRGITVCDRWRDSFEAFLEDMGPRPSEEHSLDRYPDNNGNYEPGNCRWATQVEQSNNRRTNVYYDYASQKLTISEISRLTGVPVPSIRDRIQRGFTAEEAVLQDDVVTRHVVTYQGQTRTLAEWAKLSDIPFGLIYRRYVVDGMSFEKAIMKEDLRKHRHVS